MEVRIGALATDRIGDEGPCRKRSAQPSLVASVGIVAIYQSTEPFSVRCGHCGRDVAATVWNPDEADRNRYLTFLICPSCHDGMIRAADGTVHPRGLPSRDIQRIPEDVAKAWQEARASHSVGAYTASEIMCRKILMHLAVDVASSKSGSNFVAYINDLDKEGYIPKGIKGVVDQVRDRGNIANHELPASTEAQADQTIRIVEYLLHSIYELPGLALPDAASS